MFIMSGVTVNNSDLPDEYIDPVVSFDDAETASDAAAPSCTVFQSLVPSKWMSSPNSVVFKKTASNHDMKLSEYDLPDEYVDAAVLSFDETSSCEGTLPLPSSPREMLLGCLAKKFPPEEDRNDSVELTMGECDLPDGYIGAEVCSPRRQECSPLNMNPKTFETPTVGLSRRRREYPSSSSSDTLSSVSPSNHLTNTLVNANVPEQKFTNQADIAEEEWIPEMKVSNSSLRKRRIRTTE
jgi:hypothetical protein